MALATSSWASTLRCIVWIASTISDTLSSMASCSCDRMASRVSSIALIAASFSSKDESLDSMLWIKSLMLAIFQSIGQFGQEVLLDLGLRAQFVGHLQLNNLVFVLDVRFLKHQFSNLDPLVELI